MRIDLTKRAAIYSAAIITMIYVLNLVQRRDPWHIGEEGISAMLGLGVAAVLVPVFFIVDLVRHFRSR